MFVDALGEEQVTQSDQSMGGEDFSQYGLAGVPIFMYRLGSVRRERLSRYAESGSQPPSLHSSKYYPDVRPALETGVTSMVAAVRELLPPRR